MIGCQTSLRGLVACQPCACKKLVHVDRVRFFHEAGRPDTLAPYLRHRPVPPPTHCHLRTPKVCRGQGRLAAQGLAGLVTVYDGIACRCENEHQTHSNGR